MTITILDGGMGQELLARTAAKPTGLWSTQVMMDHPDAVSAIHRDYFAAGSDIATTNSYAIHRDRLEFAGIPEKFDELHVQAARLACAARDAHGSGRVAGSLGPLGWSYMAEIAPPSDEAAVLYREIVALQDQFVDLFIIETMSGIDQARGALLGCIDAQKPIWLSMTVDDEVGTRLRSGEPLADVLPLVSDFEVDAILLNCSRPEAICDGLEILSGSDLTFGAYANGFTSISENFKEVAATSDRLDVRRDLGPEEYAAFAEQWANTGATIIGGCCEVGPAHIAEVARRLNGRPQ